MLKKVAIYSKAECHLCDVAKSVLKKVQQSFPFELIEVDITENPDLFEKYKEKIPVICINEIIAFKYRVDEKELMRKLRGRK